MKQYQLLHTLLESIDIVTVPEHCQIYHLPCYLNSAKHYFGVRDLSSIATCDLVKWVEMVLAESGRAGPKEAFLVWSGGERFERRNHGGGMARAARQLRSGASARSASHRGVWVPFPQENFEF